jgi:hypothetical protein
VAGLVFALLFTLAVVILRSVPILTATDAEIGEWFASGQDSLAVVGCLYLAPFAGIAFLWFMAVVRDQVGEREDRFLATVFFGSGLLFLAIFFAAFGITASLLMGVRFLDQAPPTASTVALVRSLAYALLFGFGTRVAALFLLSTATVGLRTGTFPGWFALVGYATAIVLLVVVSFFDWIILALPAWVAFVSLFILRREWSRRRMEAPA